MPLTQFLIQTTDPKYEEEVSGCTASVGIISKDKIYVVSKTLYHPRIRRLAEQTSREMLVTRDLSWELKAEQNHCPSTISRKMKVCCVLRFPYHDISQTYGSVGEKARICAAGGFVDFGRVNGNLALSRAIGDFEFKKSAELSPEQQIVTAFPDVVTHSISDDDEFLVIACDGT